MLETVQIWFISDNALGMKYKKTPRTRQKKAPHENYLVILFFINISIKVQISVYFSVSVNKNAIFQLLYQ